MIIDQIIQTSKVSPNVITIDKNTNLISITESGNYHFVYNDDFNETNRVNVNVSKNIDVNIYEYYNISKKDSEVLLDINYDILENSNVFNININNNIKLEINKKTNFNLSTNSKLNTYSLELGNNATTKYNINLNKEGSTVNFNLMTYADNDINQIHEVNINHLAPHTSSVMNNHGVINNKSTCEFDVKTFIKKGCTKSDAHQASKILTLNDKCISKINPQLLIDEYDVVAGHAASCGHVNDEIMYYMQSRGINKMRVNQLIAIGNLLKNVPVDLTEVVIKEIEKRIIHE